MQGFRVKSSAVALAAPPRVTTRAASATAPRAAPALASPLAPSMTN